MSTMIYREGASRVNTRANLCPNPRYLGPDGLAGGGSIDWPQVDITEGAPDGGGWTKVTADTVQDGPVDIGTDDGATAEFITAGDTFTGSLYMLAHQPVDSFFIYITWRDDTGAGVGNTNGGSIPAPAVGQWHRLTVTGAAPAGATHAQVRGRITLGSVPLQPGESFGVAQRMIEEEVFASPYFDGDYPVDGNRYYDWFGEPHASPSLEYEVASAVVPDLVLNYEHRVPTGVTVHRTVTGLRPVITRNDAAAWHLPVGTYQFFSSTQQLAEDIATICDGTTNVTLDSGDVPGAPFTFCPTDEITMTWNVGYRSWIVSVPYVRVS